MESPPDDLKQILSPNEQVQLYLKQKIYRPKISIDSVVITNMRVILRHPHALGLKKDYTDYNYQEISNVELAKGVMRSTLKFTLRLGGDPLVLDSIPNDQAQKAYGLVRENLVKFQSPCGRCGWGHADWDGPSSAGLYGRVLQQVRCAPLGRPVVLRQVRRLDFVRFADRQRKGDHQGQVPVLRVPERLNGHVVQKLRSKNLGPALGPRDAAHGRDSVA